MPLLSRGSSKNFETLTETSRCDNVLLEYNLALELQERGLIDYVFPILIGDMKVDPADADNIEYGDYYRGGCSPNLSQSGGVVVQSIQAKLAEHLNRLSLGCPILEAKAVKEVIGDITSHQGAFLRGKQQESFQQITQAIVDMTKT